MPNNPRAVENLIPAKKGEIRNPKGKPKGTRSFKTIYRQIADMSVEDLKINLEHLPKGVDAATATAIVMFREAILSGNVQAAKEAFDRAFDKVTDKVEHSGEMQNELKVTIVNAPADES